jgi:hypothetical protein
VILSLNGIFLRLILSVAPAAGTFFGIIVRATYDLLDDSQFVSFYGKIIAFVAPIN